RACGLRGHYVWIATLGSGEVVSLVILNWDGLTRGPLGITGSAPLPWATTARSVRPGCERSNRTCTSANTTSTANVNQYAARAVREDDVAARAHGIAPNRYKAFAFAVGGVAAGVSGGSAARLDRHLHHPLFDCTVSILGLAMGVLGRLTCV
ncbi:ABC transporter permease subunit, partial [Burkholderia cenocepacia]|uniref:ABC transporter permease subunit n=1 Tax=Burkholderia cenocepacia TaxID=95486 RepID=UPI00406D2458